MVNRLRKEGGRRKEGRPSREREKTGSDYDTRGQPPRRNQVVSGRGAMVAPEGSGIKGTLGTTMGYLGTPLSQAA